MSASSVHTANRILQVGTMKRFDPGIAFARLSIMKSGQSWRLSARTAIRILSLCDDRSWAPILTSKRLRPAVTPKRINTHYLMTHGSRLVGPRFLGVRSSALRQHQAIKLEHTYLLVCSRGICQMASSGHCRPDRGICGIESHEGFQIYGEHGRRGGQDLQSLVIFAAAKTRFRPREWAVSRPLGADTHFSGSSWKVLRTPSSGCAAERGDPWKTLRHPRPGCDCPLRQRQAMS